MALIFKMQNKRNTFLVSFWQDRRMCSVWCMGWVVFIKHCILSLWTRTEVLVNANARPSGLNASLLLLLGARARYVVVVLGSVQQMHLVVEYWTVVIVSRLYASHTP